MTPLPERLFLSVGAMKAGTTWMYKVLAHHPDIYFCPEKETHYFAQRYVSDENPLNEPARLKRAAAHATIDPERNAANGARARLLWTANYLASPIDDGWYRNLFAFRGQQKWCADFSNLTCFLGKDAWAEVRSGVKELRTIYTMRDPLKRLWSHAKFHAQFTGNKDLVENWTPDDLKSFIRNPFIWKNAEYGKIVRDLKAGLDESEIRFFFFEDIHSDQRGWLRGIEEYLDIGHHPYSEHLLQGRVNESMSTPMPEWFPDLVRDDVERICEELIAAGLEPPTRWLIH